MNEGDAASILPIRIKADGRERRGRHRSQLCDAAILGSHDGRTSGNDGQKDSPAWMLRSGNGGGRKGFDVPLSRRGGPEIQSRWTTIFVKRSARLQLRPAIRSRRQAPDAPIHHGHFWLRAASCDRLSTPLTFTHNIVGRRPIEASATVSAVAPAPSSASAPRLEPGTR